MMNYKILIAGMFVLSLLFPYTTAFAHILTDNGRISGQLLNGTQNNAPLAGQTVMLQMAQGNNAQDLASTITDAYGTFSFGNLATDKTRTYAVYIRYQGAQYVSDLISLASNPVQQVNLTVYEATTSVANIAILQGTILMHEPDAQKGTITVSEFFLFKNLNTHTYVGSLDASQGKPNALLFSLPHDASNITLSVGFDGYKALQVDHGFATDAALLPGNTQFAFSFEIPYTASTYDFSYTAIYPTVALSVMVPPDVHAASTTLTSQGVITTDQRPYHLFKTTSPLLNQEVHLQLEGLPTTSAASTSTSTPTSFNGGSIWPIAILLLMLALAIAVWFLYRGHRRQTQAASKQGTKQDHKNTMPKKAAKGSTDSPNQQQVLLQELLDLDKAFEAGSMSKASYEEQRSKTKAQLRALMEASRQ